MDGAPRLEEVVEEFDEPKTAGVLEEGVIPANGVELGVPNAFKVVEVEDRDGLNADGAPKVLADWLDESRGFEAAPKVGVGFGDLDAKGSRP